MEIPKFIPHISPCGRYLFILAGFSFLFSSFFGLLASIHVGVDSSHIEWIKHLQLQILRPLHTMLSLSAMIAGAMGITSGLVHSLSPPNLTYSERGATALLLTFILLATLTLANGISSGREYQSWHPSLSALLIIAILWQVFALIPYFTLLKNHSPEGTWLLFLGWILTCFGLIESQFYLLPTVFNNAVKDLTIQWHGIDTVIAGINVLLYSGMIFFLQQNPKPLRKKSLFIIAGFGLLGTFGHHHYGSPQPNYLKWFAFLASMVAVLSFSRHILTYVKEARKQKITPHPIMPLILSAELWTLVAVGSGILFAIPHINFFVHGTYLITVHAMGSMIGINFMIVVAGGLLFMNYNPLKSKLSIRIGTIFVNLSILLLWLGLAYPSIQKGMMRTHFSYQEYFHTIEPWLIVFPIAGIPLIAGLFILLSELFWISIGSNNHSK